MNFKLHNSMEIPAVGLGTWQITDKEAMKKAIDAAIDAKYRHIDTAKDYKNEDIIGEVLEDLFRKNTIRREDLFITSKLWNSDHGNVRAACEASLRRLRLDYLDLYLVHWPVNSVGKFDLEDVWASMESLVADKKVKAIGVANFGEENLTHLLSFCTIKPVVNQIEFHPYLPQNKVRSFCSENDILVISYSTLGSTAGKVKPVRNDPLIMELARKYGVSSAQILLSYAVQEGSPVIPRSSSPEHIKSNMDLITIKDEDMERIKAISTRCRFVDPVQFGPDRFK